MLPINLGKLQAGLSTTCFGLAKLELFGARKTALIIRILSWSSKVFVVGESLFPWRSW